MRLLITLTAHPLQIELLDNQVTQGLMKTLGQETVYAFQSGDEMAFKAIYEEFYAGICYYAQYYLPDQEEARDLAANSFLKLWNKRAYFESLPRIKSFLEVSTRNEAFNRLKKRKSDSRHHKNIQASIETVDDPLNGDRDYLQVEAELLKLIFAEIDSLVPQRKEVFMMAFVEQLSNEEIAARLNMTVDNVYNLKSRTIKALRLAVLDKKVCFAFSVLLYHRLMNWN